jgi:hypothetical protein
VSEVRNTQDEAMLVPKDARWMVLSRVFPANQLFPRAPFEAPKGSRTSIHGALPLGDQ